MHVKAFCGIVVFACLATFLSAQELAKPDPSAPESIVVTADDFSPYAEPDATTATKTATPIIDVPQTIVTVTHQLIDDQNDVTLEQALSNVAGVSVGGTTPNSDTYRLRGFDATGRTFLDGLAADTEYNFQEELFGLDRVEVLLGPASVLYGQGPAGGLVNLISKTPSKQTFANVDLEGGSYGEFEAGVDVNTTLDKSGSVYGRVVLAYHQLGEFTDDVGLARRLFFAPSLTIDLTQNTHITFLGQFYETWINAAPALPAVGTVLPDVNGKISIFRNVGEPDTFPTRSDGRRGYIGYQLEHRFNDLFTLRQSVRAGFYKENIQNIYGYDLEADQRTLDRFQAIDPDVYQSVEADTSLVGTFTMGPSIRHTALAGVDFLYFHDHYMDYEGSIAPIDLYNPRYGAQPYGFVKDFDQQLDTYFTGLYFQDQIELFHRVTIVAGGREDYVINNVENRIPPMVDDRTDKAFSPRTGIVYEIVPKSLSTYFSWSRSFLSSPLFPGVTGAPLPPELGEQYEVGMKADALEHRLTGLLAFYHITRTNVPTPDAVNPNFYDAVGEQRHRGIDLDLTFRPMKGWDFVLAYGFIDARITQDATVTNIGNRSPEVPENSYSFWTRYTLQSGPLHGLGAGLRYRYLTRQEGDTANSFAIPSYGLLDLALYYTRGRFKAQVNVNNVTNERYFSGVDGAFEVQPGQPVSIFGNVGWNF